MIIENRFDQGDPEWLNARIDSIGSTDISRIITTKGKRSTSREGLLLEKAGDIISRDPKPNFQSWEIAWGHKYEPDARSAFSFAKKKKVDTCAMIFLDDSRTWHVSPDFINEQEEFGGEIKCYQLKAFKECLESDKLPTKHILQVQSCLAITGWELWYFIAYFPGLKPFILEVGRDEDLIRTIKVEVRLFINDLNKLISELKS